MPQPSTVEKRQKWKDTILKQKESGQSVAQWCRSNNILQHQFFYWKKRLFPESTEYQGIYIILDGNVDTSVLQQCLISLKRLA